MEYGICRLSVIPVRKEANHRSEMVTQLLFGEHYSILEYSKDKLWVRIKLHFDGYTGWLPISQHYPITEEYFEQINESDYKICTDISSTILYRKSPVNILMGSIIPISTNEIFKMEEQLAFAGESKGLHQKREYEFIRQMGQKLLNTPYLWGGRSPYGIDCSGFIQLIFRIGGYNLPRDSADQAEVGLEVASFEDLIPGDLVLFRVKKKVDHVGMVIENSQILHASGKVRIDELRPEGIYSEEIATITHKDMSFRRVLDLS